MRKKIIYLSLILFITGCGANNVSSNHDQSGKNEDHVHQMTYVSFVAPTCISEGVLEHYHCALCDKNFNDVNGTNEFTTIKISKIEHNFVFDSEVEPTCLDAGYSTYKCTMCGKENYQNFVDAKGHNFDNSKSEHVDPTCLEAGYDKSYCTECHQYITFNVIDPLGHIDSSSFTPVTHEATCTEDGYVLHHCQRCDEDYVTDEVSALGHDYDEENIIIVEATCENAGYTTVECNRCHEVVKEYTEQLPHDFVDGVCSHCHNSLEDATLIRAFDRLDPETYVPVNVTKSDEWGYIIDFESDPSADHNGDHYCLINISKSTIEALVDSGTGGLSFKMGSPDDNVRAFAIEQDGGFPAVNVGGYSFCPNWYTKNIANADGTLSSLIKDDGLSFLIIHGRTQEYSGVLPSFALDMCFNCLTHIPLEESHQHFEATCEEDGYDQYTCSKCGLTYQTNVTEALGHNYSVIESYDEATCDHIKGSISKCSRCGDIKSEIIEDKKNHQFVEGTCVNCHKTIEEVDIIKAHDNNNNSIECIKNGFEYLVKAPLSDTYKSYVTVDKDILQGLIDCGYTTLGLTAKKADPSKGRTIFIHDEDENVIKGANFFSDDSYYTSTPICRIIELIDKEGHLKEEYEDGFVLPIIAVANGNSDTTGYKIDVLLNKSNEIIAASGFNSHANNLDGSITVSLSVAGYCYFAITPNILKNKTTATISINGLAPFQPVSPINAASISGAISGVGSYTLTINDYLIDGVFYFGMYFNGTSPFTVSYTLN